MSTENKILHICDFDGHEILEGDPYVEVSVVIYNLPLTEDGKIVKDEDGKTVIGPASPMQQLDFCSQKHCLAWISSQPEFGEVV